MLPTLPTVDVLIASRYLCRLTRCYGEVRITCNPAKRDRMRRARGQDMRRTAEMRMYGPSNSREREDGQAALDALSADVDAMDEVIVGLIYEETPGVGLEAAVLSYIRGRGTWQIADQDGFKKDT